MGEDMEQKEYSLAVIPGDGVGTEVCSGLCRRCLLGGE